MLALFAALPFWAIAQQIDNVTLTNAVAGDYKGYSIAPFTFVGIGGSGAGFGHVAAGNKTDLTTSAQDSVNIMLIPDGPTQGASVNIGISGATDIRAVAVTKIGSLSYYPDSLFAVTLQVRGGTQKDRIVMVILAAASYSAPPAVVMFHEMELPDRNWYPTSADFDGVDMFYICGFATEPSVAGFPHEPVLTDSKTSFILRHSMVESFLNSNPGIEYNLFDSPIPMNPPPSGVTWNGLYNDYDIAQHIRIKTGHIFLTGSCNGESNTSWGGTPWPVNTSCAFLFDLEPTTLGCFSKRGGLRSWSNGDHWTLPEILPNRLPTDPSGLCAVDAMLDATGMTQGFWVVQNRLDTTQWHLTHITRNVVNGRTYDTVSGASGDGFNTLRDSLYKNAIVYGAQRHEFPLSTAQSPIGIYGKYGTDPFLISLDPYFRSLYVTGMFTYSYYSARSSASQFMHHPTLSPDPTMVPEYYPYWLGSDCSRYNLPNSGTRFSVGSTPNYIAQMGQYDLSGASTPRLIQGDEYGESGGICSGAFTDITSTDLLLGNINVVPSGDFGAGPGTMYYPIPQQLSYPHVAFPVFDAGMKFPESCAGYSGSGGIHYRLAKPSASVSNQKVSISPNPANEYVNVSWGQDVDLAKDVAAISITDMLGRQVLRASAVETYGADSKFSLSALVPGVYYINCTVNGRVVKAEKLIIVQ